MQKEYSNLNIVVILIFLMWLFCMMPGLFLIGAVGFCAGAGFNSWWIKSTAKSTDKDDNKEKTVKKEPEPKTTERKEPQKEEDKEEGFILTVEDLEDFSSAENKIQ